MDPDLVSGVESGEGDDGRQSVLGERGNARCELLVLDGLIEGLDGVFVCGFYCFDL